MKNGKNGMIVKLLTKHLKKVTLSEASDLIYIFNKIFPAVCPSFHSSIVKYSNAKIVTEIVIKIIYFQEMSH